MSSDSSKQMSAHSVAAVRRIDAVCDRLEESMQAGRPWRLEDFLAKVVKSEQPALLRQLLLLEWDYRQQRGDRVDLVDYLGKFPEHSTLIRETSEEHTLELESGSKSSTAAVPSVSQKLKSFRATQDWSERGYLIVGQLGRGGMSTVYLACQTAADRLVALKVLHDGVDHGHSSLDRFRREAQTLARLQHPNIVPVFEVGESHGQPFYSMEYCAGGSLADHLDIKRVTVVEAATLVETLARATHAAHQAGIIHRDLKPSNVLLSGGLAQDGLASPVASAPGSGAATNSAGVPHPGADATGLATIPMLADFGLAKKLDASAKTQTGAVLGTPQYMAPEQARGESQSVGAAADVYGLGAILYECLTGRPPFVGSTIVDIVMQVLSDDVIPPAQLQRSMPRDLNTICMKCLHKEPHKRYADAAALAEDLRRFRAGEPILARPVSAWERAWKWAKRYPAVTGLLGVLMISSLVGLALSVWALQERDAAIVARENAKSATAEVELQRRTARHQAAVAMYEQALSVGEQQGAARAMLWLAESLKQAVNAEGTELEQSIRRQLGAWSRDVRPLKRVFVGHKKNILAIAFSPDGRHVLTGSGDNTARLWEAIAGKLLGSLDHPDRVYAVAFSRDGKISLTGCGDGKARLWEAATGKPIGRYFEHQNRVLGVAFSPDGQTVLTGSHDKTARLWNAVTGQPIGEPLQHQDIVRAVAFNPDGKTILTASDDKTARLWDAATGQAVGEPLKHQDAVRAVAFSSDGKKLITGTSENTAQMWDTATRKPFGPPLQHQGWVMAVAFSPDDKTVVTGSDDATARLWQAATGLPLCLPMEHQGQVRAVAFSPDGTKVLTGCFDRSARLWSVPTVTFLQHKSIVYCMAFSPDGRTLLTGSADQTARFWDVATNNPLNPPLQHKASIVTVAFSPDGKTALTADLKGSARLWNVAARELLRELPHQGGVCAAAFSPDSKTVLTACADHAARLWDVATGQLLTPPLQHQDMVTAVAFSRDGKTVLTGSDDKTARLWEAATGKPWAQPMQHGGAVWRVAFSPDCTTVLTAGSSNTARLWESTTGKSLGPNLNHFGSVTAVAFSPDGKRVLTGSADKSARIWDVSTKTTLGPPLEHKDSVVSVAFSPDGTLILTGSRATTAHLWEAVTSKRLGPPLEHQDSVTDATFSPDGKRIVSASYDKMARLWEVIPPIEGDPERVILWTQVNTGMELDGNGGVRILDAPTWRDRYEQIERLGGFPIQ